MLIDWGFCYLMYIYIFQLNINLLRSSLPKSLWPMVMMMVEIPLVIHTWQSIQNWSRPGEWWIIWIARSLNWRPTWWRSKTTWSLSFICCDPYPTLLQWPRPHHHHLWWDTNSPRLQTSTITLPSSVTVGNLDGTPSPAPQVYTQVHRLWAYSRQH